MVERNKLLAKMGLPSDASLEDVRLKYEKLSCLFRDKLKSKDASVLEKANKNIKMLEDIYAQLRKSINYSEAHLGKRVPINSAVSTRKVQTNRDNGRCVCTKCEMVINPSDRFCNNCGMPAGKDVRIAKNIHRVALIAGLLVCLSMASLYFYNKEHLSAGKIAHVETQASETQASETQASETQANEESSNSQEFRIDARNYYKLKENINFVLREYDSESGQKFVFALGMIAAESTGNLESLYNEHANTDMFVRFINSYYKAVMEGEDVQLFLETLNGKTPNEVVLYAYDLHEKYSI